MKFTKGNSRAAKLSNEQVYEIRDKYWNHNRTQASLAREYMVVPETIGRICRGESRQSVPDVVPDPTPQEIKQSMERLANLLGKPLPEAPKELPQRFTDEVRKQDRER